MERREVVHALVGLHEHPGLTEDEVTALNTVIAELNSPDLMSCKWCALYQEPGICRRTGLYSEGDTPGCFFHVLFGPGRDEPTNIVEEPGEPEDLKEKGREEP